MTKDSKKPLEFGQVAFAFETHDKKLPHAIMQIFGKTIFYLSDFLDKKKRKEAVEKLEEFLVLKRNIRRFDVYVYRYLEK